MDHFSVKEGNGLRKRLKNSQEEIRSANRLLIPPRLQFSQPDRDFTALPFPVFRREVKI